MPIPQFTVNTKRYDPYKNFKFRVKWNDKYVAGISKVGALKRTTEVVEHREGADPSTVYKSPGQSKYEAIMLERGVTHDKEFELWANKVWTHALGGRNPENFAQSPDEVSLSELDFRKDIIIEMLNEAGQIVLRYIVYRCWVSEFTAMPELDASANAVAIQSIQLQNEGWIRDTTLNEPTEVELSGEYPQV